MYLIQTYIHTASNVFDPKLYRANSETMLSISCKVCDTSTIIRVEFTSSSDDTDLLLGLLSHEAKSCCTFEMSTERFDTSPPPNSSKMDKLPDDYPRQYVWSERLGILMGVPGYLRSRRQTRRVVTHLPMTEATDPIGPEDWRHCDASHSNTGLSFDR
jgi:hypothetical protein